MFTLREFLTTYLLYNSFSFAFSIVLLVFRNLYQIQWTLRKECVLLLLSQIGIILINIVLQGVHPSILLPFLVSMLGILMVSPLMSNYTLSGRYFFVSYILLLLSGLLWSTWFVATIPVSFVTRGLLFFAAPFVLITFPSGVVQIFEQFEVLCRVHWIRPRQSFVEAGRKNHPKVSLHVPVYAEPPEIVKETLTVLSQIDYPNFEVIVVDNNTTDETLWRPVQAHCQTLGQRFHFFHVENLEGAKAGALNFALVQTCEDAEIIGVIDSDYHAESDFLKSLIGYFDDSKMGFVQSPHDYRGWERNAYLRMCYYEYKIFFHTTMVSINERDAAITVGTMCLIRKIALQEVGGWAQWCVTEDSELAIRIHALGYSSVYLSQSFGRGLIPATFADYKKQRYRWTAGPVQEFKHHFSLLMRGPWSKPSLLSFFQRLHHLNHGLDRINIGIGFIFTPIGIAIVVSMVLHREIIPVPFELWVAATVLLAAAILLNWISYKVILKCSLMDTIAALIANKALSHTVEVASFKTILNSRVSWERTNKFKATSKILRAFDATKIELLFAMVIFTCVTTVFLIMPVPGLLLMFLIGLSYKGIDYLFSSLVAIFAEYNIR